MSELVIAVALFCGEPYPAYGKTSYTNAAVNQCRHELFDCAIKNKNTTEYINCFKTKEIGQ